MKQRDPDRDLDDEIASHLAEAIDDYVAQGYSPDEARLKALRDFGGVTQTRQIVREMRSFAWIDDVRQDVRYAVRRWTKDRVSTAVAVMTLALGIGVSSALLSVIDATMLRPLPYPDPDQLVTVSPEVVMPDGEISRAMPSMEDLRTWQSADDVFSAVAGWGSAFRGRITDGPEPARIRVQHFTEDYLSVHGVTPLIGRDFTRADGEPGSPLVALLGYGYWQSRYGGRPDVVGQTIRLDNALATIVGVLPAWFYATTPIATPLRVPPREYSMRGSGRVQVLARLRPGVTLEQARDRASAITIGERRPGTTVGTGRAVVTSEFQSATSSNRTTINVLTGAVALILLIACVNVAGLLLARGGTRESELALRASLGAGRGRLLRQLLTESVVLALAGGGVGVLLAWLSLDVLVANLPLTVPVNSPIALNLTVLSATAALLVPTTLLFALAPAIRLSRVRIPLSLARGSRQAGGSFSVRRGQFLIAGETALALVLLVGAGLMIRSFVRISSADLGFSPDGLMTMEVLPLDRNPAVQKEYYRSLLQQVRTIPGIAAVGVVDNFALGDGTSYTEIWVGGEATFSTVFDVMPGYLDTIGATLRDGRLLSDADYASGSRGVVLNESAARKMFGGGPAVGRELARGERNTRPWTVIGVIADLRHRGPLDPRSRNQPQVFFPFEPTGADPNRALMLVMRPDAMRPGLAGELRRVAQSIGPRVLVERIRTADEWFADRVITPKRRTVLLGLVGTLGLVLALVGIFGMTAYAVTRRTAEIGVRMAFGARPGQVVQTMVRDAALPIAAGTIVGIVGARLASPVIESFLFETAPTDPTTLAAVAVILAAAGCAAAFVPARRAAKVDPAMSLRAE